MQQTHRAGAIGKTQREEFEFAHAQGRIPYCISCEHPLEEIREEQGIDLVWHWDTKTKRYIKSEVDGWSNKPYCGHCETKDWEFTNNGYVEYENARCTTTILWY
jgi:hypothetical protein